MEKVISSDERIRRAQEIYYKRKSQNSNTRTNYTYKEKKNKKDFTLFKKLIMQIIVCLIIYVVVYVIKNSNYIFSQQFLDKVNEVLSYDIDLERYYNNMIDFFNSNKSLEQQNDVNDDNKEQNNVEENNVEQDNKQQDTNTQDNKEENIGGANEQEAKVEQENTQNLSQMEIDSIDIKNTYTLIKPLEGKVTSRFGQRDPTTPTVPKNHTGIDIGAVTGTEIIAALDGIVEVASSEGDYGKHLKIKKDDIELVYAHCSKLLKKQGDEVKQGEVIAQVGATRKCNRSTFTF